MANYVDIPGYRITAPDGCDITIDDADWHLVGVDVGGVPLDRNFTAPEAGWYRYENDTWEQID